MPNFTFYWGRKKTRTNFFPLWVFFGFHILLPGLTIRYYHSFKSFKLQSWRAVYISRRCEIAKKDTKCVNFWCTKFRENITVYQTSMKTIVLAFLNYFPVRIKFLNVLETIRESGLSEISIGTLEHSALMFWSFVIDRLCKILQLLHREHFRT